MFVIDKTEYLTRVAMIAFDMAKDGDCAAPVGEYAESMEDLVVSNPVGVLMVSPSGSESMACENDQSFFLEHGYDATIVLKATRAIQSDIMALCEKYREKMVDL
ncbi:MAG: hypothetical protein ACRC47_10775 [Shewanella sp.]